MFLIKATPLTNIPRPNPQEMSFFSARKLNIGSLVEIKMRNKKYPAIVLECDTIKHKKSIIRSSTFALKPIEYSIIDEPVLFSYQIELAKWISQYYWTSFGLVLKKFIPKYLLKNPDKFTIGNRVTDSEKVEQTLYLYPMKYIGNRVTDYEIDITSKLGLKKEFDLFNEIRNGNISEVKGTKSALFAPYINLKKIIIYEELDQSHLSWDQKPHYSAVSVAKKLAELTGAKIENHCSIPSLFSWKKNISFHSANRVRSENNKNNKTKIIDLINLPYGDIFIRETIDILNKSFKENKKVLLYINRRGYSRLVVCKDCGFMPQCKNCSVTLTYHKKFELPYLLCHYCLYKTETPKICDKCGYHNLGLFGFGTQQVEQKIKEIMPFVKVVRLDSDVKKDLEEQILDINNADFTITTSIIFKFKNLEFDCVIALAPDLELNFPDYNAFLYTFFNLWRLKNFAKNDFAIQTYDKENIIYNAILKNDYKLFYENELKERKALNYPPFTEMIKLTFSHKNEVSAINEAKVLNKKLEYIKNKKGLNTKIFDFMPALIYKLKGKFRYEIIIKIGSRDVKKYLLEFIPFDWEVDILE
ncbi:MAG: primosomal protein N' [Patescibacteria group bacterium]